MGERDSEARQIPDRGPPRAHAGWGKKGLAIIVLVSIVAFIFLQFFSSFLVHLVRLLPTRLRETPSLNPLSDWEHSVD